MIDRRAWDPFAPHPRTGPAQPLTGELRGLSEELCGLDAMRKPDLIALAEQRDLDTTGTRADLITRLREAG